jgi:CDP-diacylglycerol--glycerol-3-phosphate 3-phosphatidyltransferase
VGDPRLSHDHRDVGEPRLGFRRLSGLDRSGPPPAQTLAGQPLRPWTIPNAIGYVRLALLPLFLVSAYASDDGRSTLAAVVFAVIAWSDYADGLAARLTGQYSRLGALLDPVIDRLLVVSGMVVCWSFQLLPRWAIALLVARELFMLVVARAALRRGLELQINWPGRLAVWPTMSAVFFALVGVGGLAEGLLYVGLALALAATALYVATGRRALAARRPSTSA